MGKILNKIREFFIGEKRPDEIILSLSKNKKMNDTEKFKGYLNVIGNYYLTEHKNRTEYETYEEFFEEFCIDGKKDFDKYEKYYKITENSINHSNCKMLFGCVNDLQNVNVDELTENEKVVYAKILECVRVHFPKAFDYVHYAFFAEDSENYDQSCSDILNDIVSDYKNKEEKKNEEELAK